MTEKNEAAALLEELGIATEDEAVNESAMDSQPEAAVESEAGADASTSALDDLADIATAAADELSADTDTVADTATPTSDDVKSPAADAAADAENAAIPQEMPEEMTGTQEASDEPVEIEAAAPTEAAALDDVVAVAEPAPSAPVAEELVPPPAVAISVADEDVRMREIITRLRAISGKVTQAVCRMTTLETENREQADTIARLEGKLAEVHAQNESLKEDLAKLADCTSARTALDEIEQKLQSAGV